jgi:hypothetical protein
MAVSPAFYADFMVLYPISGAVASKLAGFVWLYLKKSLGAQNNPRHNNMIRSNHIRLRPMFYRTLTEI